MARGAVCVVGGMCGRGQRAWHGVLCVWWGGACVAGECMTRGAVCVVGGHVWQGSA